MRGTPFLCKKGVPRTPPQKTLYGLWVRVFLIPGTPAPKGVGRFWKGRMKAVFA